MGAYNQIVPHGEKSLSKENMKISSNFNSFCDIFKIVANQNSNDIAIIFQEKSMTYSQLDFLSNRLAKILISRGVKRGDVIALGLFNDLDLIVALLAIWKANGVYLPIDPNLPKERINLIFEDAQPNLLITKKTALDKFSSFSEKIHFIDEIHEDKLDIKLEGNNPNDLAYIMHTSGSTGKPKGIMVEQIALKHAALAYRELHPEKPVSLVVGSISFDTSLLSIIHSLSLGGTICLYNNRNSLDVNNPKEISDIITKYEVTFILTMPFFYTALMKEGIKFHSLLNVDLCGENISKNLLEMHEQFAPNAFLYNVYGPTEVCCITL